jgi:hypothetical protein
MSEVISAGIRATKTKAPVTSTIHRRHPVNPPDRPIAIPRSRSSAARPAS